jgi:hypothetical protein
MTEQSLEDSRPVPKRECYERWRNRGSMGCFNNWEVRAAVADCAAASAPPPSL